jgi:hypothetical protein
MLAASNTLDEILRGSKGKKKRKSLKAYYYDLEGEIKYILYKEDNETYYDTLRDPQGRLHKQEETQIMGTLIPTAQWEDGHTHVQFPRPKEYTLGDIGSPLDRISVKQLTLEFSKNKRTATTAPKEWDKRMISIKQTPPDWTIVADRYATRFLTHKDAATHFKHITHRAIFTRNRKAELNKKDRLCRLCHKAKEDSLHMGKCQVIQTLFSRINRLKATAIRICSNLRKGDQTNNTIMEILFLAPRADIPLALGSLLTILWKYTLMHWYKVDIEKKQFIKDTVWGQAIRRFAELCLVQLAKYRKAQARAQARGAHEPTTKYNNEMEPLASIRSDGALFFSKEFTEELKNSNGKPYIQKSSGTINDREFIKWIKPRETGTNK